MIRALVLAVLFGGAAAGPAQSIRTIGGGGTDDGRPATVLGLSAPTGVAVDIAGNVYIADQGSHRIRKVNRFGIITTVAGNGSAGIAGDEGPATTAELFTPTAIAIDASGNLYVADGISRIRRVAADTQTITRVAGSGVDSGFAGDGGPATMAKLSSRTSIAVDHDRNLYIADFWNNRVRKVDGTTGLIHTIAGNGQQSFSGDGGDARLASLSQPSDVAVDTSGNVYVADSGNDRVRRIDARTGTISTFAGNGNDDSAGDGGPATAASVAIPQGVSLDAQGNVYVVELFGGVRMINAVDGTIRTVAGSMNSGFSGDGGPATEARLTFPNDVVVDGAGNLLIADFGNRRIRFVSRATGIITTLAGNGDDGFLADGGPATAASFNIPDKVAADDRGNLYVSDFFNNRVRRIDTTTGFVSTYAGSGREAARSSGDGGPATEAVISGTQGMSFDADGNLFIADFSGRIRRIDAKTGIITTVVGGDLVGYGGDGEPATAAKLAAPTDVVVNGSGDLYIADRDNHRIRKVDSVTGMITTVAGSGNSGFSGDGGPAIAAELSHPNGVALDEGGNLYIADSFNNRVRKVRVSDSLISTVAGNGSTDWSGDGGPATAAGLDNPLDVTIDLAGQLLIADTYNHRVRRVAIDGTIMTLAGTGPSRFGGDGGPATSASLNNPAGVAVDRNGNVYIADSLNYRVRAIFACIPLDVPHLTQPALGTTGESSSPRLAWTAVRGTFHYDVYLDTAYPPKTIVAGSLTVPTYNPSNLEASARYYWKVVANGDPHCTPFAIAESAVYSFTTSGACGPPGSLVTSPGGVAVTAKGDPFCTPSSVAVSGVFSFPTMAAQ